MKPTSLEAYLGKKSGKLTVIGKGRFTSAQKWVCRCDCGVEKEMLACGIRSGKYVSCGCQKTESRRTVKRDITSQRFGSWTAIEYVFSGAAAWKCRCDCGTVLVIKQKELEAGIRTGCKDCWKRRMQDDPTLAPGWKGGQPYTNDQGYVIRNVSAFEGLKELYPERLQIKEHVAIMALKLGRRLLPNESVHHKNAIRNDNSLDNLELWVEGQPAGARVEDKIEWALETLRTYRPELLLPQGA